MNEKVNKIVVSAHGLNTADGRISHMLGQLRDEGIIVIDDTPVTAPPNPFDNSQPYIITRREPLPLDDNNKHSKDYKLHTKVTNHINGKRTLQQEAELIRQKRSSLPANARKYLMDVMLNTCP